MSLVASILVGLTFFIAGSGKVVGFGELPGQTIEFIDRIIPDALLTPAVAHFIGSIFLPYILPWAELALGALLLVGFAPRFMAALSLPLSLAFAANNSWMLSRGVDEFASCGCFGIWEELLWALSPLQSLYLNIGLIVLALVIIFLHPGAFFSSQPWLAKLGEKKQEQQ